MRPKIGTKAYLHAVPNLASVWKSFVFHATYSPELLVQFLMEKFVSLIKPSTLTTTKYTNP
jgi:hypothetical protein